MIKPADRELETIITIIFHMLMKKKAWLDLTGMDMENIYKGPKVGKKTEIETKIKIAF